jgi:hypothetical protein
MSADHAVKQILEIRPMCQTHANAQTFEELSNLRKNSRGSIATSCDARVGIAKVRRWIKRG